MSSFELCKWRVSRFGLSQLAIAIVLSGAGCSSSGDDDGAPDMTGTGGATTPSTGGAPATGGKTAPAAGSGGGVAIKPGGGTGGTVMVGTGGAPVVGATGGTGGMTVVTMDAGMVTMNEPSCLDDITDYENDGPFTFTPMVVGQVKMFVPDVPAGCKVPVIHLANGTGASCSSYQGSLNRMATHGFLSICYEDPNTGAGDQGVMAFDAAFQMFPDLADNKLGSTGHSQGGQAAFTVLQLAEAKYGDKMIYAGLAMEPASGFGSQPLGRQLAIAVREDQVTDVHVQRHGPTCWCPRRGCNKASTPWTTSIEAYWWSAVGATHIPVPNGEEMQISIPWFRWKLLGDQKACEFFKKMPDGDAWDERMSQNPAPCM